MSYNKIVNIFECLKKNVYFLFNSKCFRISYYCLVDWLVDWLIDRLDDLLNDSVPCYSLRIKETNIRSIESTDKMNPGSYISFLIYSSCIRAHLDKQRISTKPGYRALVLNLDTEH